MGFGRNSYLGWAQEATWGTGVSVTKYAELVSENLRTIREREARPVYRDLDEREGNLYDVKFGGDGPKTIEASYEGLLRLLEHTFGAVNTVIEEAAIRWGHTFSLAAGELMAGKGLSVHVGKDLTTAHRLIGGKVRQLRLVYDPRRNVQAEIDLVGKDVDQVTPATPTFPASSLYVAGHQVVCEIDDVARAIDSAEITLANGLDDDKRVLGSKYIAEPVRSDTRRIVTGRIVADAADADWTKLNAGTLFKLELLATGPTLGNATYKFNLTALKCLITEEPVQVTGPGIVKSTINFKVLKPSAGSMLDLLVSNAESAVA